MRVTVAEDICCGHGVCLALCPDVFSLTDDGYAVAVTTEIPEELRPAVHEAMASCPEKAITTI